MLGSADDRLFLDSGAFSVWTQGAEIDVEVYADFCSQNPEVSYYVNLDAIPGRAGQSRTRSAIAIEDACERGWRNYQAMLRKLPIDKVIPVFHRGETGKWLKKMIDFGAPYIGIGQAVNFGSKANQKKWLDGLADVIVDGAGRPRVKTHGFAVTSFQLMKHFPWHSVDSTSWLKQAAFGTVYVPKMADKDAPYSDVPMLINVSPKSPSRDKKQQHIDNLSPILKEYTLDYFRSIKAPLGETEVVKVPSKYKKKKEELWYDKTKTSVIRELVPGLATDHQRRFRANAIFISKVEIGVKRIYFAGGEGSIIDPVEYRLKNRLMSYHKVGMKTGNLANKTFNNWRHQIGAHSET
jgi:hypothetical protein